MCFGILNTFLRDLETFPSDAPFLHEHSKINGEKLQCILFNFGRVSHNSLGKGCRSGDVPVLLGIFQFSSR